jgi:hypothetical protein
MALPNNYTSGLISNNLFLAERPAALLECSGASWAHGRSLILPTSPCWPNPGRLYPGGADN